MKNKIHFPPPKRIAYLAPSVGFGGAETFLLQSAKHHDPEKFESYYICFVEGPLSRSLKESKKNVFILPKQPRISNPVLYIYALKAIAQICKLHKIDLVHSTMAYGALFGAPVSRFLKIPHVWFQHGPVTGWLDRLASMLPSNLIYVNSEHTLALQKRVSGRKNILKLTLGVDFISSDSRIEKRSSFELHKSRPFVLGVICRPQPQKGLKLFLDTLDCLRRRESTIPFSGIVVGFSSSVESEMTDYEREIFSYSKSLGLSVSFEAATSNTLPYIKNMDVLLCTSILPEAFGLTIVEAMASGTIVIGPREGGPAEILVDGENGFLYEPRSAEDLASKILRVANLVESEKTLLKAKISLEVHEKYNAVDCIANLEQSYQKVLDRF